MGPGAPTVKTEGSDTSVINDNVSPHGDPPHVSATIVTQVVQYLLKASLQRKGDSASCGHVLQDPVPYSANHIQAYINMLYANNSIQ